MQYKREMERKVMKVSDIKIDITNPNKMNDKEEKALASSISRFGYVYEIIVDRKTGMIADGEHRLKQLIKEGKTEVEVKLINFKNDAERRMFRQITAKVKGTHDDLLDTKEYKLILAEFGMEELTDSLAVSEQEVLNLINSMDKESQETVEKVDQIGVLKITCPFCHKSFEKGKDK